MEDEYAYEEDSEDASPSFHSASFRSASFRSASGTEPYPGNDHYDAEDDHPPANDYTLDAIDPVDATGTSTLFPEPDSPHHSPNDHPHPHHSVHFEPYVIHFFTFIFNH
jgi:hypothetical protein